MSLTLEDFLSITGIDLNSSYRLNQNADASAIFPDGIMKTIKVNMTKSSSTLFDSEMISRSAAAWQMSKPLSAG